MADFKPILLQHLDVPECWKLTHYAGREDGDYRASRKAITEFEPQALIAEVKDANLRGRGGAGFPAGLKWGFLPDNDKPRYLAVNADESEPGTFKDRQIMAYNPHLLIDGIIATSWACKIHHVYIFIRGEFVRETHRLQEAIDDCYAKGILGDDVLGLGKFKLEVTVIRGAGAYICGEETGLLSAAEGDRGYPKIKPPFPAVEGYYRCPTIVNNVETIACVPHIVMNGAAWFKSIGPSNSPGPRIFGVSGHVNKPGFFEVPMGTTLRSLIYDYAGGPIGEIKAVIPGGSSMPVFTADKLDTPMDFDSVREAGSLLGSGGIIVMNTNTCLVNALLNLAKFYHHESCGQCTPCREGLGWMEKLLRRMEFGEGKPGDLELLEEVVEMVKGRTICLLADSLTMPIESFLKHFREEFEYHLKEKKCMTGGAPGVFAPVEAVTVT